MGNIESKDIVETKSFANPPAIALQVINTVMYILENKKDGFKAFKTDSKFLAKLKEFNILEMNTKRVLKAKTMLNGLTPEKVRATSKA